MLFMFSSTRLTDSRLGCQMQNQSFVEMLLHIEVLKTYICILTFSDLSGKTSEIITFPSIFTSSFAKSCTSVTLWVHMFNLRILFVLGPYNNW